jgi:hypothetical protein
MFNTVPAIIHDPSKTATVLSNDPLGIAQRHYQKGNFLKSRRISMRLSVLTRVLCYVTLVPLALLFVGLLAVSAGDVPTLSPVVQLLPTRPSAPKPPPEPPSPGRQRPDEPSQPPTEEAPPPTPTPPPTPSVALTFKELGHDTFQLSESGSRGVDLYLPRSFVPNNDQSYVDLIIDHTPPEPDKLSVVRVELNGASLAVITLSQDNAEPTTHRFHLGNAPLTPGRNELRISLDTGAVCNVRGARVDVTVYDSSLFHLEYSLTQHPLDLALYPSPFFERSFEQELVYVVLPQNLSAADLSAAATTAAGLGKFSNGDIRLGSALDAQVPANVLNNHHLIVVGKVGVNQLLAQLELPLRLDDAALSGEEGLIQVLVSPWNPLRMILVVTGRSDEGLSKASQALNREARLLNMQGPVAIVEAVLPSKSAGRQKRDADFTVADLGYKEEVVYGTRPHMLDYRFDIPPGCTVTEEARFTLHFGHAIVISPDKSSLDVHFNDIPVRSIVLDEGNASDGILELPLPSWLIHPGRNEVRISIEMNLDNEDKCLFLDSEHVWVAIYSDSFFHLPCTSEDVEPSLDLFPYPFNKQPDLSGLLLVLPDRPRQLDYDIMLNAAAGLGAADQGDSLALDVTTADIITQKDLQDRDLILVGRASSHSLIAELNDGLPQPFEAGADLLRPQVESAVFVQDSSRDIGLIQELVAPWDSGRAILVLTGTTDEGIVMAGKTLLSQRYALTGNVVLIEESVGIRGFDVRSPLSTPGSRAGRTDVNQTLLIQLGERWW